MNESAPPISGRLVAGVAILALGVLWTADNLGFTDAGAVLRWWPSLLVVYGIARITGWCCGRNRLVGILCAGFGGLMLGHELGWVRSSIGLVFPLALVILGVQILRRGSRASESPGADGLGDGSDYLHSFALLGASSTRSTSQALRRAELTAILGGVELDLRAARPANERVVVDLVAFMGGIQIIVPANWRVEFNAAAVIGGLEDARGPNAAGDVVGTLVVRGVVMLGGVELTDEKRPGGTVVVGVSRRGRRERFERRVVSVTHGGVRVRTEGPDGIHEVRMGSPAADEESPPRPATPPSPTEPS